ncbi:MAG: DUF975 family protein, partial [Planctomycetota bacterium]
MTAYPLTENRDLMTRARQSLNGNWGSAIGATVVYSIIVIAISFIPFGQLVSLVISGPLMLGFCMYFLSLSRDQNPDLSQLFKGFDRFGTAFCAYLLQAIFVFLWMLLLIIPGIIASLSYAMTYYIITDNESIGALDAITASKELMRGNKWKLFCLGLRFIGWSLLCILTLGIGYLWLTPYIATSFAKFYDDISDRHIVADSSSVNTDVGN